MPCLLLLHPTLLLLVGMCSEEAVQMPSRDRQGGTVGPPTLGLSPPQASRPAEVCSEHRASGPRGERVSTHAGQEGGQTRRAFPPLLCSKGGWDGAGDRQRARGGTSSRPGHSGTSGSSLALFYPQPASPPPPPPHCSRWVSGSSDPTLEPRGSWAENPSFPEAAPWL